MVDQLVAWHKEFAPKGLVIVDIDNGQIDTQADVKAHVEKKGITYATLWDKGARNCSKYGVRAYPAQYLVGVDGKVIWEGFYAESEDTKKKVAALLKAELAKVKKEDLPKEK